MKKKILNDIKIIIIILIGVTILFAILGSFKMSTKENMDDSPQCYPDTLVSNDESGSSDGYGSDSNYASFNESIDDKYILKTKIVPPKGTSCPIEISKSASEYLNGVKSENISTTQNSNISNNSSTSSMTNITNTTARSAPSATPVPADSQSSTPEKVNDVLYQNNVALNEIKGSISQINQQQPKNESCPPCPACERCPEPAFDCKKVPNYRSPSIGQYLPMPVLNDFSTF